ncbi:right-handed parallel beta-helix repeat-containing protein [Candidatus Acetothermia bacterium]|nr:right-handed parallel beta-helix repeat-containing protein [Candidatus Acetothermia bacterium]
MYNLKFFVVGVVLFIVAMAIGNSGQVGLAQPQACTMTLNPNQSLQAAIDQVTDGAVICLLAATYQENILVRRSLTLRGAGQEQTFIKGQDQKRDKAVLDIDGLSEIPVVLEGLVVSQGRGSLGDGVRIDGKAIVALNNSKISANDGVGLRILGSAQAVLSNSLVSSNDLGGLIVTGSARVGLTNTQVSENHGIGLQAAGSARLVLADSQVSESGLAGLRVFENADIGLSNTQVINNRGEGFVVLDSASVRLANSRITGNKFFAGLIAFGAAQVSLFSSQISGNPGIDGLRVENSASVEVRNSVVENNGANGVLVKDNAKLGLTDSVIRNQAEWGLTALLKQCGFSFDGFTGQVSFEGANIIEGNNKSGTQNSKGNPGNHPFKGLPDGQVCLP